MNATERREQIKTYLSEHQEAVSATALAKVFSVSRQIIVGDIALLRAAGEDILATPRGYIYLVKERTEAIRTIACMHDYKNTEKELNICVDHGCTVLDVIIGHPLYGQITGELQLSSRYDVAQFMKEYEKEDAHPLSELTDGIHLHTLRCPSQEAYENVCKALAQEGMLLENDEAN